MRIPGNHVSVVLRTVLDERCHVGVLKGAQTSAAHRSWHGVTRVTFGRQLQAKDISNPWLYMTHGVSFPFGSITTCWVTD